MGAVVVETAGLDLDRQVGRDPLQNKSYGKLLENRKIGNFVENFRVEI
jgi:hypothetical protein